MTYTRPTHGSLGNDSSVTDAVNIVDALSTGVETLEVQKPRVTHPNTDDVLVQVWDVANARWQVAHYDSGWRTLTPAGSWTGTMRIRRVNHTVTLATGNLTGVAGGLIYTLPTGFRTNFSEFRQIVHRINSGSVYADRLYTATANGDDLTLAKAASTPALATGDTWSVTTSWDTQDAIPASLPGSTYLAAPYA